MSDRLAVHQALESTWQRLYSVVDGARFERRSDLVVALYPSFPIPQCNGPWVVEDSQAAVDALPEALAEVEAAGAWPWVQTRAGHYRTQQLTRALGLTHTERIPGMIMRPGEFVETQAEIETTLMTGRDAEETNTILAGCFGTPKELFDEFWAHLRKLPEASLYIGRQADGAIVSTAVAFTLDGATGVFNVATPTEHRGHGYGSALTSRAVRDGFDAGSEFAFLQSSELGHGVYKRLGFREVEEYVLLTRPLPASVQSH